MSTRQTTHDTPIESARIGPDDPRYLAVVDKRFNKRCGINGCTKGIVAARGSRDGVAGLRPERRPGDEQQGDAEQAWRERHAYLDSSMVRLVKHAFSSRFRSALMSAAAAFLVVLPSPRFACAQSATSIRAADGGVVMADVYGSGDRGVILAHGGRFDRASWRDQAQELAAAGFRVVAIDFRAAVEARAGRETECLYDAACLAKDVLAAVRHLRETGARTVSIVGASLGGGAAAEAAAEAPRGTIDKLVLVAHMPIDKPERIQGRKLFILSRDDRGSGDILRLPSIRAQFEKAPPPKELVVLDGSAHAQFIFQTDRGPRLMREILRFLTAP